MEKLIAEGYLEDNLPTTINTVVNWKDETQPIDMRVRSYIDVNCAHCHTEFSYCDYRPMRFAFGETADEINLGVCVDPDSGNSRNDQNCGTIFKRTFRHVF